VNPSVPRWISAAIMRALSKAPTQRFRTAAEFNAALTDEQTREVFDRIPTAPSVTRTPAVTAIKPPATTVAGFTPPPGFDPATLDRLSQALAAYLGPIAKVLVNRAARGARNVYELQEMLATEIPEPADRRKFLTRVRSAL
jgi:eukaryotic-like serine/threonine-protein kinase